MVGSLARGGERWAAGRIRHAKECTAGFRNSSFESRLSDLRVPAQIGNGGPLRTTLAGRVFHVLS